MDEPQADDASRLAAERASGEDVAPHSTGGNGHAPGGYSATGRTGSGRGYEREPRVENLIDGLMGSSSSTTLDRPEMHSPSSSKAPTVWPPRPASPPRPPSAPARPAPAIKPLVPPQHVAGTRVGERLRRPGHWTHRGLRPRWHVILAIVVAAAMIAAALFTVRTLEASASTNFPGVLSSTNTEYLNFVNQGTLASVNVTAGETVVAGQILAVQDNAAQAAAVVKDNVLLASDEQALGALLGPSGKLASQAAAKLLNKAYASSTADQQRGAASVSEAEAEVNAASAALTIAQGGLVTDRSAYKSGCPAGVGAGCQALAHNIVHDQTVITQDQTHVSNAQQILAHAQGLDGTLTNLAQQVLQDANQANPSVLPTVIQAIRQAREAVANDLYQQQVDQANLAATELPAPFAGKVIGVYAAADEIVGSAGTRLGSSSQASSVPSQGPSAGTSLSPSSPSNSSAASEPFISLNATGMQAVAQVPEAQISAIRLGEKATVTVNALSGNAAILHGRVSSINLQPVEVAGAVYYNVTVVPSTSWPSKVFAGMTANVAIP